MATNGNCAGAGLGFGGIPVVGGIGPAEIAAAPGLIAFGDPAYQAAKSRFAELGQVPTPGLGSSSLLNVGDNSSGTASWALQLLTIMLLVGLVGIIRTAPVATRRRVRPHDRRLTGVVTRLPGDTSSPGQPAQQHDVASERDRGDLAA